MSSNYENEIIFYSRAKSQKKPYSFATKYPSHRGSLSHWLGKILCIYEFQSLGEYTIFEEFSIEKDFDRDKFYSAIEKWIKFMEKQGIYASDKLWRGCYQKKSRIADLLVKPNNKKWTSKESYWVEVDAASERNLQKFTYKRVWTEHIPKFLIIREHKFRGRFIIVHFNPYGIKFKPYKDRPFYIPQGIEFWIFVLAGDIYKIQIKAKDDKVKLILPERFKNEDQNKIFGRLNIEIPNDYIVT